MGSEGSTAAVEAAFRNDCNWQADKARKGCFNCETTFTLITRRHHCRCCGEVFCPQCWGSKEVLPMSLFPSTQRLVQRIKDTIPYDEKLQLNERLKQPQPVCRCCLAVITGLAGPLREGVELRLIRVGLKPCADDEAESGRKATATNFTESASACQGPTEYDKDGNGQPVPTGAGPGASPSTEIRRHRSFGCESVDVQPYEREGTAVYCEGGENKVSTVVVCSGAPVEETSPQVRLQSPAVAETSSPEGISEGRYEEGPPPTNDRTEGGPGQRLVEDGSSRKTKSESVGIRWSAVSAQCFLVNIAGWRPFNRGTHLRFTSPGGSGLLHSTSSTIPSFTDATIPIVMSLAAPPHDYHDACQFIPSSESYPDLGSASLGERPVTPPPSAAVGVSASVGSQGQTSAIPGATLVTVNGDSFALRSALKRGSSKRDKRDLHLKRSESVENFQFETLLPPVWRLSLRAIQKCSVAVHDHSAQATPTLQLETESQILIFSASDNFSLTRMERAIAAAVELSRVRARIHIAAPK